MDTYYILHQIQPMKLLLSECWSIKLCLYYFVGVYKLYQRVAILSVWIIRDPPTFYEPIGLCIATSILKYERLSMVIKDQFMEKHTLTHFAEY